MKNRKAKMSDVKEIQCLINYYADKGLMLPRSLNMLYENILELTVLEDNGKIVAVGGLHVIWENLAEIRSLAVSEDYLGKGLGKKVVKLLLSEAENLELSKVFALTYQQAFFEKCGFQVIEKDDLHQKVWKECINCPKFPNCDEIAVAIDL